MNKLTILTPTYNRAYIIDNLFQSLMDQTSYAFEWLVIDDGSTDDTKIYFETLLSKELPFELAYIRIENGGKQRAINYATRLIHTEFVFIVDSDDSLTKDAVSKVSGWLNKIENIPNLAGVSGVRGTADGKPIGGAPTFSEEYIEINNLQRDQFNLKADMAEIYRTSLLRKYPFFVWPGEKFVPEALVWDAIAKDGYKLRWYKDVIYKCEYLEDGLTKGSWKLLRENPMGYAMLYDHMASMEKSFRQRLKLIVQMDSCLWLSHELTWCNCCNQRKLAFVCLPIGGILAMKRKFQFAKY